MEVSRLNGSSNLEHPEFTTHQNYVEYLRSISENLNLRFNNSISAQLSLPPSIQKKIQLIKATVKNLEAESNMVLQYPEYAEVAISWIPVKAYYLIFNLTTVLEYLISTDPTYLTTSHQKSLNQFRKLIEFKELQFSNPIFCEVKTGAEIEKMKVQKSDNIRGFTFSRKEQVFRKLADYAKEDLRRKYKTERLNRIQMKEFRDSKFILSELFYWYRIKVNYRDLEFISAQVSLEEFKIFHQNYNFLTRNFYRAFKKCINELSFERSGTLLL